VRFHESLLADSERDPSPGLLELSRPGWWQQAACLGVGVEVFFKDRGVHDHHPYELARAYCGVCPVVEECRKDADEQPPALNESGFRAGETPRQRQRRLRRERGIPAACPKCGGPSHMTPGQAGPSQCEACYQKVLQAAKQRSIARRKGAA